MDLTNYKTQIIFQRLRTLLLPQLQRPIPQKRMHSSAEGVIYDKSSSTTTGTDYKTNNAALIQKLKQDSENRINQLKDLVSQMITKQGTAIGKADDIWSFLASGDFTIDEAAKKKAQEEISEDGYWGVKQTSDPYP